MYFRGQVTHVRLISVLIQVLLLTVALPLPELVRPLLTVHHDPEDILAIVDLDFDLGVVVLPHEVLFATLIEHLSLNLDRFLHFGFTVIEFFAYAGLKLVPLPPRLDLFALDPVG